MEKSPQVVNKYMLCQVVVSAVEQDDAEQEDSQSPGEGKVIF